MWPCFEVTSAEIGTPEQPFESFLGTTTNVDSLLFRGNVFSVVEQVLKQEALVPGLPPEPFPVHLNFFKSHAFTLILVFG